MPEVSNDKEFLDLHGLERFWNNVKDYLDMGAYTVPAGKQVASVRQDHGRVVVTFEAFGGATGAAKEAARESLGVSSSEEVEEALAGKADLVDGAVEGNLAALDAEGNLVDSGVDPETLKRVQEAWSDEPDSALYTLGSIGQDANGVVSVTFVRIPDATASSSGLMSSEDKGKLDGLPDEAELEGLLEGKADKVENPVPGNLAGLDSEGNLADSGYSVVDTAGAGFEDNVPTGGAVLEAIGDAVAELDSTGSGSSAHVTVSVVQADGVITDVSVSDTAAAADHVHGNISNDGKVGSDSGKYLVTGENGVVEAGDLPVASTSVAGIVRLSNDTDSSSESTAATSKAVQDAIAAASAEVAGLNFSNILGDGKYITSLSQTEGQISYTVQQMDDVPVEGSLKPVVSNGLYPLSDFKTTVERLIPQEAGPQNQLADKAYVDDLGTRLEARYLSYNAAEMPFPTYEDFYHADTGTYGPFFYHGGQVLPDNNDVIVITADSTHPNVLGEPATTRWRYFGDAGTGEWRYEYTINNTALNRQQLDAINSTITVDKVTSYTEHLGRYDNPHKVTKEQVGLGNVDNTSDANKPISKATQTALNEKVDKVTEGTEGNIVIFGNSGALADSRAAITNRYQFDDRLNPVTGAAVTLALETLNKGPFGGEGKYIISVSETAGVVTATEGTLDTEPTENSTNPVKSGGVYQHLSTKADKDTDADEDNVAVFDENGNPVDSGIAKDDLEAAISSAGSSIQGVSIDGTALTPDANNVVDIPLATTSADGAMSAEDKAKLDGIASGAEANVQSDWTEADSNSDAFIKNKPSLATVATTGEYGDLLNIPTDLVHDASYVHTDNNYTTAEKTKLASIETGAEANVQADWTETDSNSDAFIQNKPENLVQDANYVHTDNNYTTAEKEKLAGIEADAEVNVIETVKVDNIPLTVTNKTVNIDLFDKADKVVPSAVGNLAGLDATGNLIDSGISGTLDPVPTENSGNLVTSGTVYDALDGKTDKVTGATSGNFAGLDTNGNLTDSGSKASDFATAGQGDKADSAVQTVSIAGGTPVGADNDGNVDIPLSTSTTDGAMSAADKTKLDGIASGAEANVQSDWNESDSSSDAFIRNKPANLVQDANYVHTDNNYTAAEKTKLAGIASGAEVNVQSDWTETDSDSDAFIKNKPSLATVATSGSYDDLLDVPENIVQDANYVHTDNNYTAAEKTKLAGIASGAEVNVQSDWTEADSNSDAFIKNKPSLATVATSGSYDDLSDKPTIPAAQVNSDWNATSGVARILNKPNLATVATSGSYNDLIDKPEIPGIPVTDVTVNGTSVVDTDCVAKVVIPAQQQADWNQSTTTAVDFIKNKPDLTVYATKVGAATSGNFAALDSNGNLTDSGHKHSDYKTKQTAKSSPAASGNTLAFIDTVTQNENGEITATKKNVTIDSALSSTSTNPVQNKAVDAALSGKADKATNLTGATKTKITYNSQGIVTAGADLVASDIPNLDASKITTGTLPVDRGGTGASTVEGARTNLDVYSKSEVDARLSGRVEVVSALPTTGETGVIYYVGPTGSGSDQYEEYIWTKEQGASTESWIKVGEPTIDLSGYKTKQTAKTSPSASGDTLSFIDTISQNENGEITSTKKNVTIDSALSSTSTNPVQNKAVQSAISTINTNKADKVSGATSGNFAALDANGNLTDSGHKHSDYKTKQTAKSDPTASGTTITAIATISQDANGVITATKKTIQSASGTQDGVMSSSHYTKLEGISTGANKVEASTTNGNIKIDGTETTVYTHPTDGADTSKGDTTNQTPAFGGTFKVTSETVDAMGHTTALAEHTVKIPNATAVASSGGTGGSAGLMSAADKEKLNGIATGAEVNQNAFSNVKVGTATVAADTKTDTIELATTSGKHIVLTADTANDKVTIDTDLSSKSAASGGTAESLVTTGEKYTWNSKASGTHTHGNITNDGKIGSTANLSVVTGTDGAVTTADLTTASPSVPSSGTTTSLSFIDTVSQDSKGKITATKKTVLVDSTYSSTGTNPVNGKAIAAAIGGLDSNMTSTDGTNVQFKVTLADGKVSAVNVTTDNTENKNNKVSSWQTTPDNTHYPTEKLVKDSLDGKVDKVEGKGLSTEDYTTAEKTKLAGIEEGAQVNQNAFSNVKVGSTTVAADSKTDTLELASSSAITLSPDATNDKVTIGVSTMGAASSSAAGTAGIVPAPGAGKQESFLRGDGTWVVPTNTDTKVKATAKTDNVNYKILATASASPTSGNATEAVYDTDISLNPSTNTITSNISGNAATATKPAVTTLTSSDNLNNVGGSAAGDVRWYKWASGSAPANVPTTGSAVMEVVRTHSGNYITQTVYTTEHSVYRRECINGTWGAWYSYSKSTHTHGNITSGGALQTTDVAIANGDKLVITDASDSNKIARSSTAFDGSTITKALTQKGTFESVMLADDSMPFYAGDGIALTYSNSTATISSNFIAGAGVNISYDSSHVGTLSLSLNAIPVSTIAALS